jgi:hypothetical protein
MFIGETEDTATVPLRQSVHLHCDVNWYVHGATRGSNPAVIARSAFQYQATFVDGGTIRILLFPLMNIAANIKD